MSRSLRLLCVLGLTACAVDPAGEDVAGELLVAEPPASPLPEELSGPPIWQGPIGTSLVLTVPPRLERGEQAAITVTGAAPGQWIRLWASRQGPGSSWVCLPLVNFNCVELDRPFPVALLRADATGSVTWTPTTPDWARLGPISFQAFGLKSFTASPEKSPVVSAVIVEPCADTDWWPGADVDGDGVVDLPHRVEVTVTGGSTALDAAPVVADIDFRAALDQLGVADTFDAGSVRVVRQSCDLDFPEVRAQFADGLIALDQKLDHVSPDGDERGTVAFLVDDDSDPSTVTTLGAGEVVTFGVYFSAGTAFTPPAWATDLTVTEAATTTLANGRTTAVFDPAKGGLLSSLAVDGSGKLTSQTDSCCGNSMHFWERTTQAGPPFGWVTPQLRPGTVEVIAAGPVISAVRASGRRQAVTAGGLDFGTYDYEDVYWQFAGRPELWHSLTHTAVTDCTTQHVTEASFAFRPIQIRHQPALSVGATWENDATSATPWAAVTGAAYGLVVGLDRPPAQFARVSNPVGTEVPGGVGQPDYLAFHGNELVAPGLLSPQTIPAGERYFDNVGVVFLPYAGGLDAQRPVLSALLEGVVVDVTDVSSAP